VFSVRAQLRNMLIAGQISKHIKNALKFFCALPVTSKSQVSQMRIKWGTGYYNIPVAKNLKKNKSILPLQIFNFPALGQSAFNLRPFLFQKSYRF
jgi:hypothetical protein